MHHMHHRVAAATLALLTLVACSDQPTATTSPLLGADDVSFAIDDSRVAAFTITPLLPLPGKLNSEGFDNEVAGRVAGVSYVVDPMIDGRPTVWFGAAALDYGVPAPATAGVAYAVNAAGIAAGVLSSPAGVRGFWGPPGGLNVLSGPPGTTRLEARDVNVANVVVGGVQGPAGIRHAFRYTVAGGYVDLHPAGVWVESHAEAINAGGTVVGWASLPNGDRHLARWTPAGVFNDLGLLVGTTYSEGQDINVGGAIGGVAGGPVATLPFLYRNATGFQSNPTNNTAIQGVSDLLRLTGYTTPGPVRRAWTKFGAGPAAILPLPGGFNSSEGNAVNVCGSIAGSVRNSVTGLTRAVAWVNNPCD